MKIITAIFVALSVSFVAISCGSDSKDGRKTMQNTTVSTGQSSTTNSASSTTQSPCDQFMNDYEAFADSYIAFMKEYKSNPADMALLSRYSDMVKKASEMLSRSEECKGDPAMLPRLQRIQVKLAGALN